jgi:GDP-L-fucose synthase
MMKILLTGSNGMVGRNVVNHLLFSKYEWLLPCHNELELKDYVQVENYLSRHKPNFIIHAAGKVGGIQANIREPVSFLIDNFDMGRNLLLAANKIGVKKLLNLGSSCMYPRDRNNALIEEDVLSGHLESTNEGYALAKISVARLASYLNREDPSLMYKTLIPCNLFGPYDKFDPMWSHMIPAVLLKLHFAKENNADSVEIWGAGEVRREFMYAGDLVDAIYKALDDIVSMPELLNIGLGNDYTVNEYYQVAAKVVGYKGGFHHDLSKPVGMNRKLTCVEKAHNWGWHSSTSLENGLAKTYQYLLENYQTLTE